MAYTSEIEKLERRNAENPQGRLFAPLADAYRKQGELERAMTLLREGLERHPDYIGAQIVLGRCHLDLGSDDEAAAAFARVLDLDGENVIALKALAEIDERGGRAGEAIARLGRLLEIDRGNEEAVAHLGRLRSAGPRPAAAEPVEAEPPVDADAPHPPPAGLQLTAGFGADPTAAEPTPPPAPLPGLLAGAAEPPAAPAPRLEGLETVPAPEWERSPEGEGDDFVLERESDILLEGSAENEFQSRSDAEKLAARDDDGGGRHPWQDVASEAPPAPVPFVPWEAAAAPAPEPPEAVEPVDLVEAVEPVDLAEAVEPMDLAEAVEPVDLAEDGAEVEVVEVIDVAEVVDTVEDLPFPGPPGLAAAPAEPDLAGEPDEPDLVVTETMAAVYERQGLSQDALRVYRELAARRPDDGRLAAKVAELEAAAAAAGKGGARTAFSAGETGGTPVGTFLRSILGTRLAAPGAVPAAAAAATAPALDEAGLEAAPTRPAADPVSLSAVFGDDLPPAGPAASQVPASPGQGFSFDAFFGAGAQPAREGSRPPTPGEDDLEQFHAWLQGLKK